MNRIIRKKEKPESFNFNARQVLLTYPKCTLPKEQVLSSLQQITEIKEYTIALEAHEDGTPHIHALIRFEKRYHTTSPRAFDISGFHPNVKTLKTVSDFNRADTYCKKDGNTLTNIVAKISPSEQLGKELLEKGVTRQVIFDNPSLIFKNFNSIRAWCHFARPNISRGISKAKKRHIWLHGPSDTGKTTWLRAVRTLFTCYEIPENNDFSHVTPEVEILFADEYRGFLTVQQLNKICDGDTRLNTKGGSFDLGLATIIIVSNYSIPEVYKNCTNQILDTLYNRFHQYDSSINLPRIPKYIIKY